MAKRRGGQYGVKQRGDRWTARPYVPGRGHVWAGTHDTEQEAVRAAIVKIEVERRLPVHKETVGTFASRWVKDYPRRKESTNDSYDRIARAFAREYGSRKLHEIDKQTARAYALAHKSDLGALRAMFGDAERDGLVIGNPFAKLRIPITRGRRDIVAVTAEELDMLADLALEAHDEGFGPVFRSILLFAAYTGLRPSEVFGLDWPDIDYETETVHVRQQFHKRRLTTPKSGTSRVVALLPEAAEALREMPRTVHTKHVFSGKFGQRVTQSSLSSYWHPVRTAFEAKLEPARLEEFRRVRNPKKPYMDFYELRHFCATYLLERGAETWAIAKQLGHSDGGALVEKVYGHPRDVLARELVQRAARRNVQPLRVVDDETEAASG